jgi:hypothetical protein
MGQKFFSQLLKHHEQQAIRVTQCATHQLSAWCISTLVHQRFAGRQQQSLRSSTRT